jgi:hypothetical protein
MDQYYDSRPETLKHIRKVQALLNKVVFALKKRAWRHDASKLVEPELAYFDKFTPLLSKVEYGSKQYRAMLDKMRPAIDHHQKFNRHHPEYFDDGINGMSLVDLLEMLCDWMAATERNKNGDILKSIEINRKRFNMSDQLYQILVNTVNEIKAME